MYKFQTVDLMLQGNFTVFLKIGTKLEEVLREMGFSEIKIKETE